ncbi:MAG: pseudouridine synthase [Acidimicrobiia bacterium]|nr:pseudouridine synthase [Acidimicrobiia bacterium]
MSRRSAEEVIRAGRVTLDGRVAVLGDRAEPDTARIAIDGVPLPVRPGLVYILLNKPSGAISTVHDPQGRTTVVDLVDSPTRVYPVGRLDADSEGLLLLTNDGTLTDLITHPRNQVTKTYVARVEGRPDRRTLRALERGIQLDDGIARAKAARLLDEYAGEALVELIMTEGRKREVRRMLDRIGHPVTRLVRIAIGPIRDPNLKPGSARPLRTKEIHSLYSAASATWQDAPAIVEQD